MPSAKTDVKFYGHELIFMAFLYLLAVQKTMFYCIYIPVFMPSEYNFVNKSIYENVENYMESVDNSHIFFHIFHI